MAVSEGKLQAETTTVTGSKDYTGNVSVLDANFSIKDDVDPTKIVKFQCSSVTSGTTRTITVPDINTTIVGNNQTTTTLGNTTSTATLNALTGVTSSGNTKTINLGTAGASGSTTTINIGSATSGANGSVTVNHATTFVSTARLAGYTVAGLPAAGTAGARSLAFVTDATVAHAGNSGNVVAGGGANFVPVYSDGTNWRIL